MAEPTPIYASDVASVYLTGRTPAAGNPTPPAFLSLRMRLRVRTYEFSTTNALGLGDIPVWVIADTGQKVWYWKFDLDEEYGQFASLRWYGADVTVNFPVEFKPANTPIQLTFLHGEWQTGWKGSVGLDVAAADILTEYAKKDASDLWIGQSARFRIPDDASGDDDLYGGNQPWYVKATNSLVGTIKTVGLVGVAAYAVTRAYQSKR